MSSVPDARNCDQLSMKIFARPRCFTEFMTSVGTGMVIVTKKRRALLVLLFRQGCVPSKLRVAGLYLSAKVSAVGDD
jgi:hypothetical protein